MISFTMRNYQELAVGSEGSREQYAAIIGGNNLSLRSCRDAQSAVSGTKLIALAELGD